MNSWWIRYLPGILREWLEGRAHVQRAVGNTGWLLVDRVVRMVIGVTVGAWVARYLGPAQFGELAYVISFIAFFQVIADLQADGFIIRDIAQRPEAAHLFLGTALWLRLGFATAGWVGAAVTISLLHPDDGRLIRLALVIGAMMVFQVADTVDLWFQSQSQSRRTVIAKFAAYLVSNGVRVFLLLRGAPLEGFAAVIALEAALVALSLAVSYRYYRTSEPWRPEAAEAWRLLHLAWPFIASGLMITTYMRIDQIMLKEMLGEHDLGIYAAALPLSQVWAVVPATLVASLAPYVARKKVRSEEEYRSALVIIFRFFAIVSVSAAIVTAAAAPWLVRLLYGPDYAASAAVLGTLVVVNVFAFQGLAQSLWVTNDNVRIMTMVSTFLSAAIAVVANKLLIGRFGIMGAAFSTLLAQCMSVAVIPCLLRRDLLSLYLRAFLPFFGKIRT